MISKADKDLKAEGEKVNTSDISDTRWWAYDIPGNIGWIANFTAFAMMIRDREYGNAAVCAAMCAAFAGLLLN